MRILLQHKETNLYFKDIDSWTPDSKQALDFVASTKAIEFCERNQFKDVQIVLKFDEQKYDIVLDAVTPSKPRKDHRSEQSPK